MQAPLVIVDVEATCDVNMPRRKRELIEIGAVKVVDGEIIDKFQIFIKPKRNPQLSNYCKDLTHIEQSQIDNGMSPKDALTQLAIWANGCLLACWGEFDQEIIEREMHKNKTDADKFEFVNLKKVYMSVTHLPLTTSLMNVLRKEHITFVGEQHRAYDDAFNTYLIYQKHRKAMDDMIQRLYSYRLLRNT